LADEGLDIPTLNCVILAGGGKSPTKCKQRVGRAIRKAEGKVGSMIFDFIDVGPYTRKHAKSRKRLLESEPEFNIVEINSFEKSDCKSGKSLF
jgi:superfamily II DNA or RNA helicase